MKIPTWKLEIGKVITNLDHPKPQVLIKVVFVEITLDKSSDIGVNGTYTFKTGNGSTSNSGTSTTTTTQTANTVNGTTQTVTTTANPAGINSSAATIKQLYSLSPAAGGFLALSNGNWTGTLAALNTHNNVHVLSRPSIMARNNQQAVIVVGQEVPFVTNSQITDTGQINNTIQYQDVGIILRVTPFISANKTVEMIVAPEISQVDAQTVQVSTTVNAPIIDKRAAETVVVTPDATTVVIGGLMQKQKTSTVQKIPILGDIPVLGFPFRHTVKDETQTELLIFLTPYIVDNPAMLKNITEQTAAKADMAQEPMYKAEFDKSLEPMQLPTQEEAKNTTPVAKPSPSPKR
jgi:general secretion pathway protein D